MSDQTESAIRNRLANRSLAELESLHAALVNIAAPDQSHSLRTDTGDTGISVCICGDKGPARLDFMEKILDATGRKELIPRQVRPEAQSTACRHRLTYANDPGEDDVRFEECSDYGAYTRILTEEEMRKQITAPAHYNTSRHFRISARYLDDAGLVSWTVPPLWSGDDPDAFRRSVALRAGNREELPALVIAADSQQSAVESWRAFRDLAVQAGLGAPGIVCCPEPPTSISAEAPVYSYEDGASEIVTRSRGTSLWFPTDDQRRDNLTDAIAGVWHLATLVLNHATEKQKTHADIGGLLDEAELDWHEMFLDERRFALDSIRLEMVAHQLQRSALIVPGEKARVLEAYASDQLFPRIRLFLRRQSLRVRRIEGLSGMPGVPLFMPPGGLPTTASMLQQGLIAAVPGLALPLPGLWGLLNVPKPGPSKLPPPLSGPDGPIPPIWKWDKFGDYCLKRIAGELQEKLAPALEEMFKQVSQQMEFLIKIVIATQIATVVSGMLAGAIQVYSGLSLRKVEKAIVDLLVECEGRWPRIRSILEETAGIGSSQNHHDETVKRARDLVEFLKQQRILTGDHS
jgi:hypothetical protein